MAGIKNIKQIYGAIPFEMQKQIKADTIIDRDFEFNQSTITPYCRVCGGEIINSVEDANGKKVDAEWERQNLMHYRCFQERAGR